MLDKDIGVSVNISERNNQELDKIISFQKEFQNDIQRMLDNMNVYLSDKDNTNAAVDSMFNAIRILETSGFMVNLLLNTEVVKRLKLVFTILRDDGMIGPVLEMRIKKNEDIIEILSKNSAKI